MIDSLIVSNVLLWLAVLALLVAVIALSRQIGILYERVAPMGALMMDTGPKVGEAAPVFDLPSLDGRQLVIGAPGTRSTLMFFLSPTCPVCKKLLPILQSISSAESKWLDLVFASDGEQPEHEAFRRRAGLTAFPYVLSAELGMRWRISKLPYAVLIDERGIVRAKGLVNSREQIDSLFVARDMGVASVQEYMDHQIAQQQPHTHQPALAKEAV
jgi:methylamine dehydrogenase accessory protein MauD